MHSHVHHHAHRSEPDGQSRPATDVRVPLLAVLFTVGVIGSVPLGSVLPFAAFLPLVSLYAVFGEGSLVQPWRRTVPLVPVLLLVGAGFPVSRFLDAGFGGAPSPASLADSGWPQALSLFLRALCGIFLLSTLSHRFGFMAVLTALRRLGLPVAVVLTMEQMERYRTLLAAEWRRTQFAREARTPGPLQFAFAAYANQTALVFLRSWERSERIHAAMLSRGFEACLVAPAASPGPLSPAPVVARHVWLPVLALLIRLTI